MSRSRSHLAELAQARGDFAGAAALLEEALASAQAFGMTWDKPIIMTLLGHLARQQQHYTLAKALPGSPLALSHVWQPHLHSQVPGRLCSRYLCRRALYTGYTVVCGSGDTTRTGTDPASTCRARRG